MKNVPGRWGVCTSAAVLLAQGAGGLAWGAGQPAAKAAPFVVKDHYTKAEHKVPVRDGTHLFTQVLSPKDTSHTYPILMIRTPYSVGPYGADTYPEFAGSMEAVAKAGFILVRQDVRGKYMSEGEFVNMTPHRHKKAGPKDVDESTDTYDTIDWLLKNVSNHNGKVGQWGISYPGFYSAAGMIDAHPALKAVSPQAPIADWYFDDFYHHGALFLPHCFNFFSGFGKARPGPTTGGQPGFTHPTQDGYQFFLDLGPLKNVNEKYFKGEIGFWNDMVAHPAYDSFWQEKNILPHLKKVAPAVMVVGGWFDAEDLYGALNTYQAIEKQNPGVFNVLVMGPWVHGGWGRTDGDSLGNIDFGGKSSDFYREHIELPFFNHFLKDGVWAGGELPEASVFETGTNQWRSFDHWPPKEVKERTLYMHAGGRLSFDPPSAGGGGAASAGKGGAAFDEFVSDPAKPVPFTEAISTGMTREYMTDDQRFASRRPDVLSWKTEILSEDLTLAGPITADLVVSTTGTDADWVVKLIDVFPDDAPDGPTMEKGRHLSGYEMMVRSEAFRGRYRESYEHPKPFASGQPTKVAVPLQDVLHTFKKGHRVMVQVQSTWFPIMDRNPQKYVENIFKADENDFIKATHRVYRGAGTASAVRVGVMAGE